MQQKINEMNQVFVEFKDRALSSGITSLHPAIGEDLRAVTQRLVKLSRADEHGLRTEDCPGERQSTNSSTATVIESPEVKISQSVSLPDSVSQSTDVPTTITAWGYQVSLEPSAKPHNNDAERFELTSKREYGSDTLGEKLPGNIIDNPQGRVGFPESFIYTSTWNAEADRSLTSDYTYSFQESTFARRLLRSAYERASRLMSNPEANKQEIRRVLRYSLCLGTMEDIKARVDHTVRRTKRESLENWKVPAFHVGGAGLHYPRLPMDGEATPPESWANAHSPRPFHRVPSDTPVRDEDYPNRLVELANIEGEWLDSSDVEQYLKKKGLHLDGHSSIAEIEVDDPVPGLVSDFPATSPQSASSGDLTTPYSPRNMGESFPWYPPHKGDYFSDRNAGDNMTHFSTQLAPTLNMDFALASSWLDDGLDRTGDGINFLQGDAMFLDTTPMAQWPRKRKLVIDVDRLMKGKRNLLLPFDPMQPFDDLYSLERECRMLGKSDGI